MASFVAVGAALLLPGTAAAQQAGLPPVQIPSDPVAGDVPAYRGAPAKPRTVPAKPVPEHPRMAPNGRSNLHNDAFQSDVNWGPGPLGRAPQTSSALFTRECASVAFDSRGRIVTICVGIDRPVLALLHPRSLRTLAAHPLPPRQVSGDDPFTDFSGGGYFYLDDRDRAVVPTTTGRIQVLAQRDGGRRFELVADRDLSGAISDDAKLISVLPDWRGRIWFAATDGVVGWVDPSQGPIRARDLGERISNSFAVGPGGVFVVTDGALYRLAPGRGRPRVVWRRPYANDGEQKSGQTSPGSGTTPTLLGRRRIAITDNSDPIRVLVLDRRRRAPRRGRLLCREPLFDAGRSSTDQSLIGVRRSLIAENNYGYEGPSSVLEGGLTEPGIQRVDLKGPRRRGRDPDRNCRTVWRSSERAPSVVPKLSVANGLVYTYTKPRTDGRTDAWYLTALDFRNGETEFSALTGIGLGYNNNYAPVTLGPDGSAYVGVLGGLVRVADRGRSQAAAAGDR